MPVPAFCRARSASAFNDFICGTIYQERLIIELENAVLGRVHQSADARKPLNPIPPDSAY
jgi:hypothetical protein